SMTDGGAPPSLANVIGAQGAGNGVIFPASPFSAKFLDWDNSDGPGDSLGCTRVLDPVISGKVVLIQRGNCTFATKVGNAATAGALGVVIYNSVAGGNSLLVPSVDNTTIPAIFVTRNDGLNLKAYLDANPGNSAPTGTFGPAPANSFAATFVTADHDLADFSSQGPTIDFQIKPDLTSVGVGSYAACQNDDPLGEGRFPFPDSDAGQDTPLFDPSGFAFGDGTSFSAPRAAGSAALMVQKHPTWTPAEIKATLMETATRPTDPSDAVKVGNLSVMQRGSGDIDLGTAAAANSIVLPANRSFRQVFLNGAPAAGLLNSTFTVENKSQVAATYQISAAATPGLSDPAVAPTVSPSTLTLAAGASGTFTLTLNVGASVRHGQNDSEGAISVSDGGATISGSLYVPYWIRIQNQNGTPPILETASAKIDPVTLNQVNIDFTAHDNEGDIDSFSVLFLDSTGEPQAIAAGSFDGQLDGVQDVIEELQITGVTPSVCPGCTSASLQLFDSKGFASNTLLARYKPLQVSPVPSSTGSDFRRVVPLVGNTQGAGFFFQSDVRIFNPSTSHPVTINAYFVPQGDSGSSAVQADELVLPRASLALDDICLNTFDSPGTLGSLVLVSSDGSPFNASSRAYTRNSAGTFGTFVPAPTPAEAVGAGDGTATANGFETSAGFHTNVGATEVSGVATEVRVDGFDESGASVGTFTLSLLPYSNQQYNPLVDASHHFTAPAARVDFTVLSGGRVIPYGATVDEGSGDTLLSVAKTQAESADDIFITEVAHTHGAFSSFLTSDLSVTNRSSGPRTFTVSLLPAFLTGTPSTPAAITVPAGQTLVFKDVLQSQFGLTGDSGSGLQIHPESSANLFVSARTSTPNTATGGTGTYGFFVTGEKASDALRLGGKKVSIHLAHNADFRTNFGFTEVSGSSIVVRATFFDENGIPQGTRVYSLAGHATLQTNLSDLLGAGTSSNGYVEFTVDSGSGAALVFAAEIDNHTNDLIYVPGESE
ncbi:MAG: PA domain-containing protein, partial [Thermoanaerobaculia bacterium]